MVETGRAQWKRGGGGGSPLQLRGPGSESPSQHCVSCLCPVEKRERYPGFNERNAFASRIQSACLLGDGRRGTQGDIWGPVLNNEGQIGASVHTEEEEGSGREPGPGATPARRLAPFFLLFRLFSAELEGLNNSSSASFFRGQRSL